ncbi:hypothetical protein HEB29_000060 [Streptomyces fulvorobeus]|uniref:Uncharacterized protein n=1 Tax=Streptomyces fulvorobeus TaxID=284028 RepID=A0A7Y9H6Y6_9ACTN|nr:hypothetical protein [Streptomyces fulvorobeus]
MAVRRGWNAQDWHRGQNRCSRDRRSQWPAATQRVQSHRGGRQAVRRQSAASANPRPRPSFVDGARDEAALLGGGVVRALGAALRVAAREVVAGTVTRSRESAVGLRQRKAAGAPVRRCRRGPAPSTPPSSCGRPRSGAEVTHPGEQRRQAEWRNGSSGQAVAMKLLHRTSALLAAAITPILAASLTGLAPAHATTTAGAPAAARHQIACARVRLHLPRDQLRGPALRQTSRRRLRTAPAGLHPRPAQQRHPLRRLTPHPQQEPGRKRNKLPCQGLQMVNRLAGGVQTVPGPGDGFSHPAIRTPMQLYIGERIGLR